MTNRLIGVAGFKNAGKTTLVEGLTRDLTGRGYRIATVKHAHHNFDVDQEGRDSFRHRKAGAVEVAIVSRSRWALIHELRDEDEPPLDAVLSMLAPCDLVIVEGYKREPHDKIEVRDLSLGHPPLAGNDASIVALAATGAVPDAPIPVFRREEVGKIADFVIRHVGLA